MLCRGIFLKLSLTFAVIVGTFVTCRAQVLDASVPVSDQTPNLFGSADGFDEPLLASNEEYVAEFSPTGKSVSAGYDKGFFIQAEDLEAHPFRLKVNLQSQFRYTGFARSEGEWVDSAGNRNEIAQRNDFDINRGRIIFSGHAVDKDLNYYINLDYATLGGDDVTVLMAWWNYRFSDLFDFYVGKGKVPGGREWLLTGMNTMSPDRSLATTFFRPSITTGMWTKGNHNGFHYHAGIGNGFNTTSSGFRDLDTNFVYAGNLWWEPLGEFGGMYSDLCYHDTVVTRFGGSATSSRQSGQQLDNSRPEESFVRLSDGTDLTLVGALSPGFQVTNYSIHLVTLDAAVKYRGMSFHAEYFLRWLTDIDGTGPPAPASGDLFDHGFHVMAGTFVIPRYFELFARTSAIKGPFGGGEEYAGGFNYFFRGTENWRFGFDITYLNDSPAEQIRTGYDAGASGMLVRGQLQTIF